MSAVASESSLSPFFQPRGVALVGASGDPTKLGYGLARNLVQSNYQGAVHFVNPKGGSLFGRPVYTDILQAPDPLDLAILLIPAKSVPEALRQCGERKLGAAVICSGGFRESGPEGAALEAECVEIARTFGIRLLGPNCVGLLDTHLPIDATFLPPPGPLPGEVAFISHSGAICAAVIDWARGQGFGLSRLVSLGNQADLTETDVLAPVAADRFTRVLTLYLEGVSDGRRFVAEASQVTRQKPIIALKVGRFSGGQRAVASHTGALAGSDSAYQAAFRRAGVIRAETSEEMFDWARALAWCPMPWPTVPVVPGVQDRPPGRSVAVLTNAGGPGAAASDALEAHGLKLADLSLETRQTLQGLLSPAASLGNPVDMLASASPEQYAACLSILLGDPGVHGVLVILPPPPMYTAGAVAKTLIPVIHAAQKPVVVALMGERLIQEAVEHFRAARVPEYRFPERAASALAILAERADYLWRLAALEGTRPVAPPNINSGQAGTILGGHAPGWLEQEMIARLFAAYGIPFQPGVLARSAQEAVSLAKQLGFPVALKLASPDLPHKSEVGGVSLDLLDEDQVFQAYEKMMIRAAAHPRALDDSPRQAALLGATVQRMAPAGQEVILGAVQDAQFGPLIMFGLGGVEVEGIKDVAFALAPLDWQEAEYLLESTWAGRRLSGFRQTPRADREAVLDALIRLSHLAADFPQLAEVEINPLRAYSDGEGVSALDVRARLA